MVDALLLVSQSLHQTQQPASAAASDDADAAALVQISGLEVASRVWDCVTGLPLGAAATEGEDEALSLLLLLYWASRLAQTSARAKREARQHLSHQQQRVQVLVTSPCDPPAVVSELRLVADGLQEAMSMAMATMETDVSGRGSRARAMGAVPLSIWAVLFCVHLGRG